MFLYDQNGSPGTFAGTDTASFTIGVRDLKRAFFSNDGVIGAIHPAKTATVTFFGVECGPLRPPLPGFISLGGEERDGRYGQFFEGLHAVSLLHLFMNLYQKFLREAP
jgi:hypothetical protein